MSAWMTTETHIGVLSAFYADTGHGGDYEQRYEETFDMLNLANAESLKARYDDSVESNLHGSRPSYFDMSRKWKRLGALAVIKACDCFDYQSCEVTDWETSKAARRVRAMRSEAIHMLPGYDKAAWGIDDDASDRTDAVRLL